jgi:16S rRNA (guanine527-N7)-methyltransferase
VARAVAELAILVEYCLPLCRVGGRLIAPKIADVEHELNAARGAIELLGGRLREVKPVALPGLVQERCLVVLDKVSQTPDGYPRRPGMPAKYPLQ